jgi:hypothetical protein
MITDSSAISPPSSASDVSVVTEATVSRSYPFPSRSLGPGETATIDHRLPVPVRIVEIQAVGIVPHTGESRAVEVLALRLSSGERLEDERWIGMAISAPFAIVIKNTSGVLLEVRGTVFAQPLEEAENREPRGSNPEPQTSSPDSQTSSLEPRAPSFELPKPQTGEVEILVKRSEAETLLRAVKYAATVAPHIVPPFSEPGLSRAIQDALSRKEVLP